MSKGASARADKDLAGRNTGAADHLKGIDAVIRDAGYLVQREAGVAEQEPVAVGIGVLSLLGAKGAAAAGNVGNNHVFAQNIRQVLGIGAGVEVRIAAGPHKHHKFHCLFRPFQFLGLLFGRSFRCRGCGSFRFAAAAGQKGGQHQRGRDRGKQLFHFSSSLFFAFRDFVFLYTINTMEIMDAVRKIAATGLLKKAGKDPWVYIRPRRRYSSVFSPRTNPRISGGSGISSFTRI